MSIKETALPKVQTKLFINGKWTDGDNKETKDIVNPAMEKLLPKSLKLDQTKPKKPLKLQKKHFLIGQKWN